MASKQEGLLSSFLSSFLDDIVGSVKKILLNSVDEFLALVQERMLNFQTKALRNVIIAICMLASIGLVLASIFFYLLDILRWQRYAIFLVSGVILICVAVVIHLLNKKGRQ